MRKIRKNDIVVVLAGKDKGRSGAVLRLDGARAFVEGVNMIKKHVKPNPQLQQPGRIAEQEASIHLSNLAILNPVSNKADRVGFKFLKDGKKVRYFKSSGECIDIGES